MRVRYLFTIAIVGLLIGGHRAAAQQDDAAAKAAFEKFAKKARDYKCTNPYLPGLAQVLSARRLGPTDARVTLLLMNGNDQYALAYVYMKYFDGLWTCTRYEIFLRGEIKVDQRDVDYAMRYNMYQLDELSD
jgi:hypothetical protein